MSRTSRLRSAASFGLAATFLSLLPGSALAADAPLRYIGVNASGARVWDIHWVAASEDGHELIGTENTDGNGFGIDNATVLDRDVVTGVTTALTDKGVSLVATSTDLRTLLVRTAASYSPKDTNGLEDYYVWNRDTGAKTLVSVDAAGNAIGNDSGSIEIGAPYNAITQPALSGDGSVVQFDTFASTYGSDEAVKYHYVRVNVATGARTELPDPGKDGTYTTSMDDAGHVAISTNAVYVDGVKKLDLPAQTWPAVVSPDGSYVAALTYENRVIGMDVKTGQTGSVGLPAYNGGREYPTIRYVENGGKSVVLNDIVSTSDGDRLAFGRVDRSGSLTQIGGGIRISDWEFLNSQYPGARNFELGGITRNGQFAYTGLSLAQLGSTPLPGSDPQTPSPAQLSDYLFLQDSYCTLGGFWNLFRTYSNPNVTLAIRAQRADVRRPVSFSGTYAKNAAGSKAKTITIAPGKPTDLTGLGVTGGWSIDGTLTFSDGTTLKGSVPVANHAAPVCRTPGFGF